MPYRIRAAGRDDEPFLFEMLYEALFVPPGEPPLPRSTIERPDLARYAGGFGLQPGDAGRVADEGARRLGAAWLRLLPPDDPGYGFVEAGTPELSIAVIPARRGEGIGSGLLARLLEAVPRCSLSVDDRNPAVRLYERFGFEPVRRDGHAVVMLRRGRPAPTCGRRTV
jgi:GNAT superfamily N-acetyltransferase